MSLTLEQSQEIYKREILERDKKTTPSPMEDPQILKETLEIAKAEYGKDVNDELTRQAINKKVEKVKEFLAPADIINKTNHLPNFDKLKISMALQGDEYLPMTKEAYKLLISMSAPVHLREICVGDIETDLRVHPNIVLSSGKGKKNYSETVKNILKCYNPLINIKEPRTIHKEHLIGKMLLRKKKVVIGETKYGNPKYKIEEEWIPKYGYLNADLLILEEAYEIFNSPEKNDVDCRDNLTVAMDNYGHNLIQKQGMDNLDTKEETLQYYPYVHILDFMQPLKINEEFVTKGLSRRLNTIYREFPERTKLDKYVNRLFSKTDNSQNCLEFAEFLKQVNNVTGKWKFEADAYDSFVTLHYAILEQGFRVGGKCANYCRILEFPMQNKLLKMSALQALCNLRTNIRKEDVENAFVDLMEQFVFELQYINEKVKGNLDYGESWNGAIGKTQECLQELYSLGAISRETAIPIWQFQKIISEVFNKSQRRAFEDYKKMKSEGLIEDYRGQGKDNGVWLSFTPEATKTDENDDENINPKTLYKKLSDMTEMSHMSDMTIKTDVRINKSKKVVSLYNNIDAIDLKNNTPNQSNISEHNSQILPSQASDVISDISDGTVISEKTE